MIKEHDIAMLAALDRLVARYGSSSVTRLAELIRDPQRAQELAAALESAVNRSAPSKAMPKSQRNNRIGMAILKELRLSDPEKHSIVAEIRRQLISCSILQTMGDLRRFARMHDLSIGKASSRNAAIAPFLRSLSRLSTPEIISLRDSIIQSDIDDRSLERWRDVIVRPQPSKSAVEETKS